MENKKEQNHVTSSNFGAIFEILAHKIVVFGCDYISPLIMQIVAI
jgi:hypothetical protein